MSRDLQRGMALLKYFSVKREQRGERAGLLDPQGPLCKAVPSASIEEANEHVKAELKEKCGKVRAPYMVATPEQKTPWHVAYHDVNRFAYSDGVPVFCIVSFSFTM